MQGSLNEGTGLKGIVDTLAGIAEKPKSSKANPNTYLNGSISNYTKNLIMSFPILFDDTLQLTTAQIVAKANEKNITSMMQMAFASIAMTGNNGVEVLGSMHHNLDKKDGIANNSDLGIGVKDYLGIGETVEDLNKKT